MKQIFITTTLAAILAAIIVASAVNTSRSMLANAFSSSPSQQCEDAAKTISSKADAQQSNGVCAIDLSRDSPTLHLLGHQFNEFAPHEFHYGPVSSGSSLNTNVLAIFEFTLLQSEVNPVIKSLEDHDVTVGAIHNHQFFENPRLIYLHAQKEAQLSTLLQDFKDALDKTSG